MLRFSKLSANYIGYCQVGSIGSAERLAPPSLYYKRSQNWPKPNPKKRRAAIRTSDGASLDKGLTYDFSR